MYTCKIENEAGEVLELTGREQDYQVYRIDGLTPPQAQINTSTLVGLDGARFNSSKLNMRNVVIMLKINGDVEANRLRLYKYAKTKEPCRFFFTSDSRNVFIDGYVETLEVVIFSMRQTAQISILCPYPYFSAMEDVLADSSNTTAMFTFPFSIDEEIPVVISELEDTEGIVIYNSGEALTGAIINIMFSEAAESIRIRNTITGADFELDYEFEAGDVVIVDSNTGKKSISLVRDGVITNLFPALLSGSTFPQIAPGMNVFDYMVDDAEPEGQVEIQFRYRNVYRGV